MHSFGNDNDILTTESGMDTSDETLKRKMSETDDSVPMKKLRVDGEARFICAKCLFSSNDRPSFINHLAEHRIENCVLCLECGLSFAVMPSLRKHLFMVHKIKDFDNYCKENKNRASPSTLNFFMGTESSVSLILRFNVSSEVSIPDSVVKISLSFPKL
jgi:hypothetical protein